MSLGIQIISLYFSLSLIVVSGGCFFSEGAFAGDRIVVKSTSEDPLQILFQIGVEEVVKGNFESAIKIFESIAEKNKSPRVQLELARALFLDRQYRSAKIKFQNILDLPDIPGGVQQNVRSYLEQIDSSLGFFKVDVALVSDSNPRNFTDSQLVKIGGQTLKIVPPEDNKTIIGLRYSAHAGRSITESGTLLGYLNTFYSDFEGSSFDRFGVDFGCLISPRSLKQVKFKVGLDEYYYAQEHFYDYPYFNFIYSPLTLYEYNVSHNFELGYLRVPHASYLDTTNLSLTTTFALNREAKLNGAGNVYLEKAIADEKAYSYYGAAIGYSIFYKFLQSFILEPFASVGKRIYEAKDPFWGEIRENTSFKIGFVVKKDDVTILGYTPEFGITYEETYSNIDYYSYSKIGLILRFI